MRFYNWLICKLFKICEIEIIKSNEKTQGKEKIIDSVSSREVPDEAAVDFMDENFYRDNLAGFAGSGEKQEADQRLA
tara:strand:- start:56 stop:286 length:231 start_codon:yes stop_codon:yes gene_type:complete